MFDIKTITQNKLEYNKKEYDEIKIIFEIIKEDIKNGRTKIEYL